MGIPLGIGIGMPAVMLSPFMPGMPAMFADAGLDAGFAAGFLLDVLVESWAIPGIPAIGSGFFLGGFD